MQKQRFYQRFRFNLDGVSCELTLDKRGPSVVRGEEEPEGFGWDDVSHIEYSPPEQRVRLVTEGEKHSITIPFEASGKDGGFDELMETVLDHARCVPGREDLPSIFGRWSMASMVSWAIAGVVGVIAALTLVPGEAHWIVGAAVAALWIVSVWHAGFAREHLLVVESEGVTLKRVVASKSFRFDEISMMRIRLCSPKTGAPRLCLTLKPRMGEPLDLPNLGAETCEAFFTIRRALSE